MNTYTERVAVDGFEHVLHFTETDFSAFIALHSLRLGPALGGCRLKRYASDAEALQDALRLSRGMSYKNSLAGIDFGGGKCVVNADRATPEIMARVGEAVEFLAGLYITAEDVGTTVDDMKYARAMTNHIVSLGPAGDPSPWTARGVYQCIQMMADWTDKIWVQGLGKVGMEVVELLHANGYAVCVSDLREDLIDYAIQKFGVAEVNAGEGCSVYVPCAMGQVVNQDNVDTLHFKLICGSANNQLEDDSLADRLHQRGVTYCPDFLVNAGGVIAAASEITGYDAVKLRYRIGEIADTLDDVTNFANRLNTTPLKVANKLAEARW